MTVAVYHAEKNMIFRSEEQKRDQIQSWNRPDRSFFAAGACHILAAAFLEAYSHSGFQAFQIVPKPGFRGTHVFVSNGNRIFDYHGFSEHDRYIIHYFAKIRRFFPPWDGDVIRLDCSPTDFFFCQKYNHRLPEQYLHDPRPRAQAYLTRFSSP